MGMRSGDVDPSIVGYLMRKEQVGVDKVEEWFNKESGLLGVSGRSHDTRELMRLIDTDERARLAFAETFDSNAGDTPHLITIANVGDNIIRLAAFRSDFLDKLSQRLFSPRGNDDTRASCSRRARGDQSDSARRSGDHDHLVRKLLQFHAHSSIKISQHENAFNGVFPVRRSLAPSSRPVSTSLGIASFDIFSRPLASYVSHFVFPPLAQPAPALAGRPESEFGASRFAPSSTPKQDVLPAVESISCFCPERYPSRYFGKPLCH